MAVHQFSNPHDTNVTTAANSEADSFTVKSYAGGDAYDEATQRLEFARRIASYISTNELNDGPFVPGHVLAGAAGTVEMLIQDAESLLQQARDEEDA